MRHVQTIRKAAFAAAVTAAMAFGGRQAVAAPVAVDNTRQRACDPDACTRRCAREGLIGFCDGRGCWCR
jgi:hypothetical protein